MSKKGLAPTGSVVKGYIESAVIAANDLEQAIIELLSSADMEKQNDRASAIGDIFPDVGRIEYFASEIWQQCEGSTLEELALEMKYKVDDLRANMVGAIQSLNSTNFARSIGQMLLPAGEIKNVMNELERQRFENSRMRRT